MVAQGFSSAFSPAGSERVICGLFASVLLLSFPKLHYFLLSKCCHLFLFLCLVILLFPSSVFISKFVSFFLSRSLEWWERHPYCLLPFYRCVRVYSVTLYIYLQGENSFWVTLVPIPHSDLCLLLFVLQGVCAQKLLGKGVTAGIVPSLASFLCSPVTGGQVAFMEVCVCGKPQNPKQASPCILARLGSLIGGITQVTCGWWCRSPPPHPPSSDSSNADPQSNSRLKRKEGNKQRSQNQAGM